MIPVIHYHQPVEIRGWGTRSHRSTVYIPRSQRMFSAQIVDTLLLIAFIGETPDLPLHICDFNLYHGCGWHDPTPTLERELVSYSFIYLTTDR